MLQAALLRVARNWSAAESGPVAYTRTALRNLAIDGSRRRHLVATPSDAQPAAPNASPNPADAHTAAQELDGLLASLPPRQRLTVVLRVIDGLSESETATAMACSTGTVKSNLSRGLAALRTQLDTTAAHQETCR